LKFLNGFYLLLVNRNRRKPEIDRDYTK